MSTRFVSAIPHLLAAAIAPPRDNWTPTVIRPAQRAAEPMLADLGLPRLTFTVTPRRVRGVPLTTRAGRYLLTIVGDPPADGVPGGAMLIQLPAGMTLAEAMAAAADADDAPPTFYAQSTLPGGAEIGEDGTSVTVIDLTPGEWIVAGYAMTTQPTVLTVTGEMPAELPAPHAAATFTICDGGLAFSAGTLHAGRNTVRIVNAGQRPGAISIARVPRGTTRATVEATLRGAPGRLAASEVAHITSSADQSAGTTMWMSVDLEPGTYAALADVSDPEGGMAATGMHTVFTVS